MCGVQGIPFPEADVNALDVVMEYALTQLNFSPQNIVLYAWSIGELYV